MESALEKVAQLEKLDFDQIVISLKASQVPLMIAAYRLMAEKAPYPLHLGVTEAGTAYSGTIRSAVGIGALLADGIGDTIRVSLTADPTEEVRAGYEILKSLGSDKEARPSSPVPPAAAARSNSSSWQGKWKRGSGRWICPFKLQ